MARHTAAPAKSRSNLFCNHCKQPATHRRDLDDHFLCATCRTIPGVRGYRDPSKRGLDGGSPAYWAATEGQLNIVTDDAPVARTPERTSSNQRRLTVERVDEISGEVVVEFDGPEPAEQLGGTLKSWRKDVFGADVVSDGKVLLLALAERAQWDDRPHPGGNVFPSMSTLAKELGWSETRARRTIGEVRGSWLTVVEVEAWSGRTESFARLSNQYVLRWPDGRCLSAFDKRTA